LIEIRRALLGALAACDEHLQDGLLRPIRRLAQSAMGGFLTVGMVHNDSGNFSVARFGAEGTPT
jgi:hypothetical protein